MLWLIETRQRRFRTALGLVVFAGVVAAGPGCDVLTSIPDQSQFAPLASLADSGQAVVRLYATPIPGIEVIAIHPWFAVKRAEATTFDRWEVLPWAGESYGHVWKNRSAATDDAGGGTYIIAELIGAAAEAVVEFIESQSPTYPCRGQYVLLGPNSNTYARWVLDNTGWEAALPCRGIGQDTPAVCR